jgi:RHS repeat-associated protein
VAFNASGITQFTDYDPWGLPLWGNLSGGNSTNRNTFLGKEFEAETGYQDLIARQYDAPIARFTTVDPVTEEQEMYSTYQYGWNNPVLRSDPTGKCPTCPLGIAGGIIGGLVGGGIEAGMQLYEHGKINDWKAVGGATVQGAITGGVAGLTGGASLAVTVGASAGANVVGGAINNTIQGKEITAKSVAIDAAVGVTAGVAGKLLSGVSSQAKSVIDEKRVGHIFREAEGHFATDTPAARTLINKTATNSKNAMGTDKFGNQWSAKTQKDGTQVWTQSRNGKVINAGVNQEARTFNPQTGLSAPTKSN